MAELCGDPRDLLSTAVPLPAGQRLLALPVSEYDPHLVLCPTVITRNRPTIKVHNNGIEIRDKCGTKLTNGMGYYQRTVFIVLGELAFRPLL